MITKIDTIIIKSDTHRLMREKCLKIVRQMITEIKTNSIYFIKICGNGDIFALSTNTEGKKEVLSVKTDKCKKLYVYFDQVKFTSLDREYNECKIILGV